jgi:hypothetical protein
LLTAGEIGGQINPLIDSQVSTGKPAAVDAV